VARIGTGTLPATAGLTDEELVRACREGRTDAWETLVQRFSRYVYAITTQAYHLSDHDAEDVFQDVFARTYEHLDRLRDASAIRPWIGQLTRRLAIDRLRSGGREQLRDDLTDRVDAEAEPELERIETALELHAAMRTLPEHCQEILDRFFARDESYHEIAAALELPMGTIASRISRCLRKLRAQLTEPGS
jgi:RNA polymerase sigma-70 factor (ECF subfamily)